MRRRRLDRRQDTGTDRHRRADAVGPGAASADPARRRRRRRPLRPRPPTTRVRPTWRAPEIARAVASLPPDPRSGQGWNPEPVAGNYNECAQLSVVIVQGQHQRRQSEHPRADVPSGQVHPHRRARHVRVQRRRHRRQSTGDTVALKFSNGAARAGQRRPVPVERQQRRARRQHRSVTAPEDVGGAAIQWQRVRRRRPRRLQRIRSRRRRPLRVRAAARRSTRNSAGARRSRRTTNCSPAPPNSAASTNSAISTSSRVTATIRWRSSAGPTYTDRRADRRRRADDAGGRARECRVIYQAAMFDGRFVGFADFLVRSTASTTGCATPSSPAR